MNGDKPSDYKMRFTCSAHGLRDFMKCPECVREMENERVIEVIKGFDYGEVDPKIEKFRDDILKEIRHELLLVLEEQTP